MMMMISYNREKLHSIISADARSTPSTTYIREAERRKTLVCSSLSSSSLVDAAAEHAQSR